MATVVVEEACKRSCSSGGMVVLPCIIVIANRRTEMG